MRSTMPEVLLIDGRCPDRTHCEARLPPTPPPADHWDCPNCGRRWKVSIRQDPTNGHPPNPGRAYEGVEIVGLDWSTYWRPFYSLSALDVLRHAFRRR